MIEKEKKRIKKSNPNLRTLFLVLSLMAVLSFAFGGYLYYSTLKSSLFEAEHTKAEEQLDDLKTEIDSYKIWSLKSAKFLSDLKQIKQSVINADKASLLEANEILDHFHDDIKIDVCYLMDGSGKTIASSNRNTPASFMGKNYGFRPYFKQAMQGNPYTWPWVLHLKNAAFTLVILFMEKIKTSHWELWYLRVPLNPLRKSSRKISMGLL